MVSGSRVPQGVRVNPRRTFEVCEGMSIQDAINNAAAQIPVPSAVNPYTISIYPGIYDEPLAMSTYVNLKGIGPKGSVVVYRNNSTLFTMNGTVEIENLTVRMGTPTAGRILFILSNADKVRLSNIDVEFTTPGAFAHDIFYSAGNPIVTIERCSLKVGGTGVTHCIAHFGGAATWTLNDNDFYLGNANAEMIASSQVGYIRGIGNRFWGNCKLFNVSDGTIDLNNGALLCTGAWTNTGGTITLRNCAIGAPVVAGNGAIVRMKNCSYRAIQRTGTGNIVDESPDLKDAPWHVQKWTWQAALANSQVAVRGTPIDGGSGQILLEVALNVAGQEAVEQLPEAGGARDNSLIPLRTPRMITQFMWDRTGANQFVFFGLRETPGNAYPAAAEESAGFHYNSATGFVARSSTAAGDEDTVMGVAPDHLGIIQLEVIIFGGVSVEFYIDGVLVATHTTRVPTANLRWQHLLYTDGGGAATDVDVEILNGGWQQCPDSVPA